MAVDFTKLEKRNKAYSGANGGKISVIYDGELYMLKFPPAAPRNDDLSYSNSCIAEYLGCKIFKLAGVPVQEVILGTYTTNKGVEKIVVACKDFAINGKVLQDFASLKNQIIDSEGNGTGTELSDIKETFEEQAAIDPIQLKRRFWDMFIVDSLIGNWDRHNGNWGFLYDPITDKMELAPVYDCGSSLYPQADEKMMEIIMSDPDEMRARVYDMPTSSIRINGSRINYYTFITSLQDKDCNAALKRIMSKINLRDVYKIIDDTPFIGDIQKKFYKTMIKERYERILVTALKKIRKREREQEQER